MPKSIFITELFCDMCMEETNHRVIYVYNHLDEIVCEKCDKTLIVHDKENILYFTEELYNRIKTKPKRMTEEFKEDLKVMIKEIPFRVISKPYRSYKEISELRKEFKHYNKK